MIVFFNSSILPIYHDLKMAKKKKIIKIWISFYKTLGNRYYSEKVSAKDVLFEREDQRISTTGF